MSEQSGPITREQVERAIERAQVADLYGVTLGALGLERHMDAPEYVRHAWANREVAGYAPLTAALTRWRDELAAAEPVRRVARWDADLDAYALTPIHDDGALMTHAVEDAAQAIAWGYEIEGGPEPIDDSSPERLRERREALGWTTAYAGHWVPWFDHTDVERAESGRGIPGFVSRYAAALSAAEAERMTAVGAWAKYGTWEASHLEPASPPAPEVVDVPQPAPLPKTVAHFYTIRALPEPHRVSWNMPGDGPQWVRVNDALWLHVDDLRAMLADIDAQQGGAS